jgi:hypothetical protein
MIPAIVIIIGMIWMFEQILLEDVLYGIGGLFRLFFTGIGYVFLCIGITLRLIARVLWWLTVRGARLSWTGLCAACLFARIFAQEWGRQPESDFAYEGPQAEPAADPLDAALALLSLRPGFGREDLKRAYKEAIVRAHPDRGGSAQEAARVNAARDLIRARMGWA